MIEACFKGVGRSLRQAIRLEGNELPSTRGCFERADVVIVANGGANIASLQFALERLNVPSLVSGDPDVIGAASHVILPVWVPRRTPWRACAGTACTMSFPNCGSPCSVSVSACSFVRIVG